MDKILHAALSTIIILIFSMFFPVWIAALIALLIGLSKEFVWDLALKKGCFEWKDLAADIVGITIGTALITMVQLIVYRCITN